MATRFYFPATTAAEVTPAANGVWDATGSAVNRKLVMTTRSDTALALGSSISYTAGQNALDRYYVSDALGAQTISGTVKMQLQTRESNIDDNCSSRLEIYAVSNDGSSVIGTILAINQYGPATEYVVTGRNKTFADGDALSSLAISDGDRLVVAVGHSTVAGTGTTPSARGLYGDPTSGTDLAENETDTVDNPGWIEFSGTISLSSPSGLDPLGTMGFFGL